ncbi:MAG: HAD hydrolase family protein [Planctomycetota bacterium]|nr:HAD hydrolase family protein [Planctomycetota bacterium]
MSAGPNVSSPLRRYDAVICDIDGCLGPESTAPLDLSALGRVARHNARAEGERDRPVVTVCSGRPLPYAEAILRAIACTSLACVCENGVWLFDPRENAFLMDPAITHEHRDWVHAAQEWILEDLGPSGVVIQPGKAASISLWHADTAYLFSLMPRLRERFAREGWKFRVSNTVAWINLDLEHVSKATGIARLLARAGLRRERLVGVGDSMSDLAIRESVAFFACPANAAPELKPHADYVSAASEVAGVLDILDRVS